jgi:hypothetical protein
MDGLVPNTSAPEPVSPVTADARLALDGVARNVATPEPSPEIPVDTGSPVAFVSVAADGVPRFGVVSEGLVANTNEPEPVSSVTALAKLAELGVARNVVTPVPRPLIPVETGNPVQLVSVPLVGVPRTGVVSVGLVRVLLVRVSVLDMVGMVTSAPSVPYLSRSSVPAFKIRLALGVTLRQPMPSLLASLRMPVVAMSLVRDL